ncbi:hypothetical protein JOF55_003736 [Haloactinomyces albus]|uniref:Uncharacterized protein n=1 Tax=Haloactinomyces albus TaxID=1352928 RepID=A0AAE3ZGD6_9ACTN|nr:hypothetical protein [Haloactinomyces albus]
MISTYRHDSSVAPPQEFPSVVLDLPHGIGDAIGTARHVAGVNDLELFERRDIEFDVESRPQIPSGLTHGHWTEAGAGAVRGAAVKRDTENRDIVVAHLGQIRDTRKRPGACEARHLRRIERANWC